MKQYLLDANFLLRFLLKDNLKQYETAQKYLNKAKFGEIKLILPSLIMAEIVYVLDRLYKLERPEIVKSMGIIINTTYIDTEERDYLKQALLIYLNSPLHFADCYLYERSLMNDQEILTFDEDFKKLAKINKFVL